jgi:ribonuclease III
VNRRAEATGQLERRLGHTFQDRALLERALTHASILGLGAKIEHNEQLEFLGDRVLGLVVAHELVKRDPAGTPELLSKRLHALVDRNTCAAVARRIGLAAALRVPGNASLRDSDAALADTCEALIAALYLEGGFDLARTVILDIWSPEFERPLDLAAINPKATLQEWALATTKHLPRYQVVSREGPAHAPTFVIEVKVGDLPPAAGTGRSRQDAEKAAAHALLQRERPAPISDAQ